MQCDTVKTINNGYGKAQCQYPATFVVYLNGQIESRCCRYCVRKWRRVQTQHPKLYQIEASYPPNKIPQTPA